MQLYSCYGTDQVTIPNSARPHTRHLACASPQNSRMIRNPGFHSLKTRFTIVTYLKPVKSLPRNALASRLGLQMLRIYSQSVQYHYYMLMEWIPQENYQISPKPEISSNPAPETTFRNPIKFIKLGNPFTHESNHTKFFKIQLRIDIQLSKPILWSFYNFLQFSTPKY